jgi:hypothetical protein
MAEFQEHYDNLEQRELICQDYANRGLRCLHDNFDSDWEKGDEPHGTLVFTDVMPEPEPEPEPTAFTRLNPIEGVEPRLTHIEEWLESK